MTFQAPPDAYDRLIGRYSRPLAPLFVAFAGIEPGMRVLDVGCGPGALAEALAERVGADRVAGVDPTPPFAAACAERVPGADVRVGSAESLPWPDGSFDAALAQLVVSFVDDAPAAARELRRVLRPGGVAAASAFEARGFPLSGIFWQAARELDPAAPDDARLPFRREHELVGLWESAGFGDVVTSAIDVEAAYRDFDDYWEPLVSGVGPVPAYCRDLAEERLAAIRGRCFALLGSPDGGFTLPAHVLAVRGTV